MELTIIETSAYQDLKKQLSMLSVQMMDFQKKIAPVTPDKCAGCVPGSQYFQKGTADLPG